MEYTAKLLIIDDERVALRNLEYVLKRSGYHVDATQSGANAIRHLREEHYDVMITDLKMEKIDGMQLLKKCRELSPETEVIMITGYATLDSAVAAMKQGAFNYIAKPYKLDEVRSIVKEAVGKVLLKRENRLLREQIDGFQGKVRIVTQDPAMLKLLDVMQQIAPTSSNILITAERGAGKELFARYLHMNSMKADGPFLVVNCKAFSEDRLEKELFGPQNDAGTGNGYSNQGLIGKASGGTLFLDEIADMPMPCQTKLLRLFQDNEVRHTDGTRSLESDVRIVAATNRDLRTLVKSGKFRKDLYYRLNVVSLRIPSLADRKDDILLLTYYFLKKYATLLNKNVTEVSSEVTSLLMQYDFPGNVRELESMIERGVALANSSTIETDQLPDELREISIRTFRKKEGRIPSLEDQELAYIQWVLHEVGGNKTLAAQALGIDRVSLWRKLKKIGLEEE